MITRIFCRRDTEPNVQIHQENHFGSETLWENPNFPGCPRVSQSISEHPTASFDNSNFPGVPRASPEHPRVYFSNEITINLLILVNLIGAVDLSTCSI